MYIYSPSKKSILNRVVSPLALSDAYHTLPLQLEDAMAQRRARPSLLLPAWRAVGFAVGTGTTALLPAEASAKVGEAIARAVTEQYDANIRTMYESRIEAEEIEVRRRVGGGRMTQTPGSVVCM